MNGLWQSNSKGITGDELQIARVCEYPSARNRCLTQISVSPNWFLPSPDSLFPQYATSDDTNIIDAHPVSMSIFRSLGCCLNFKYNTSSIYHKKVPGYNVKKSTQRLKRRTNLWNTFPQSRLTCSYSSLDNGYTLHTSAHVRIRSARSGRFVMNLSAL
jgi:hypothetical protein